MQAIEQVIRWANGLPAWQADAVRRLLEQGELTPDDRNEIYRMLKKASGIHVEDVVAAAFPKVGDFVTAKGDQPSITLKRVSNIQNVNAIPNGSHMPFGVEGMTVVYGENGSGKSSYARILKRACRARDTKEPIHPNVYQTTPVGPASAELRIAITSANDQDLPWIDGRPTDARLAQIAYFDSKCARVIVDENNEASYIPYGCHVFDDLVALIRSFQDRIAAERPVPVAPASADIVVGSNAATFVSQLNRNTRPADIDTAAAWTAADDNQLANVITRIAQSTTNESLAKARRLRTASNRARELLLGLTRAADVLSLESVGRLNRERQAVVEALAARTLAAKSDLRDEPLAAGQANAWRLLYAAARDYSVNIAYEGKHFPYVDDDARCVLCQQPLGDEGRNRLLRFKQFMEDKSEENLVAAQRTIADSLSRVHDLRVPQDADYNNVLDELDEKRRVELKQLIELLNTQRATLLRDAEDRKAFSEPPMYPNAEPILATLVQTLGESASQAEKDAQPDVLAGLQRARSELVSRKALHALKSAVVSYVDAKQLEYKYSQCAYALQTKPISDASRDIIGAVLSPQLQADLKRELRALNGEHLPLSFQISSREGETRHQMALRSQRRAKLSEILSEGEHRVVAIAGFLAELGGAPSKAPIVFDDPVSSLDHQYRRFIAKRLVEEAKQRQVIVFTHDIAFLVEIQNEAAGVNLTVQTVKRIGGTPGRCMDGVPWDAMTCKERLQHLEEGINKVAPLYKQDVDAYNKEAAYIYSLLREAWEAFVEHELLYQTVKRHGVEVHTLRLKQVEVVDDDYVRIDNGMSKSSTWLTGHAKSQALSVNRPAPDEIRADIAELRAFARDINARRDVVRQRRDARLKPKPAELG